LKFLNRVFFTASLLLVGLSPNPLYAAQDIDSLILQIPINCILDNNCFIQQLADMDETENVVDPFCGTATYNGHKGTDFRLRTLEDIKKNVEVLAAADGTIIGVRTHVADRLIQSKKDRDAIKGIECGNGVVIDHGNDIKTQYCHLKKNGTDLSIGDKVKAGDVIGFVGASGLTEFPHLHMNVNKGDEVVDPFTGNYPRQYLEGRCVETANNSWWASPSILDAKRDANLLDANIAGAPINHNSLVIKAPAIAQANDRATVGWVWYINLKHNDKVFIKLQGPNGFIAEILSKPIKRNKASWSGFVGKKRKPKAGQYTLTTYVLRNDEKLSYSEKQIELK